MKKLITMLSGFAFLSSTTTTAILYNEQQNRIFEKTSNSIDANKTQFSIIANDPDNQQIVEDLEQLNKEIVAWLSDKIIIADGKNTYKTEKDKIEQAITKFASDKKITLKFEFISDIFTDDSIIYKAENSFEIKIALISNENDSYAISNTYKAPLIEGISKDYLDYEAARDLIRIIFSSETFKDKLFKLINIKANGENTIENLIENLNKLDNTVLFGETGILNKYKFEYYTSWDSNAKLVADKVIIIDLNVYDSDLDSLFFSTKFDFKILAENN